LPHDVDAAVDVANEYAMEHLRVMTEAPRDLVDDLRNYGSLFLDPNSPIVFGDRAVGTNLILPTLEVATYTGGIWIGTYLETLTHQEATASGVAEVAPWAAKICGLEGAHAHQLSAEARMDPIADDGD
jgi:histidinol dehydrogenase/sulfopropanediol 3-dehydrogenase